MGVTVIASNLLTPQVRIQPTEQPHRCANGIQNSTVHNGIAYLVRCDKRTGEMWVHLGHNKDNEEARCQGRKKQTCDQIVARLNQPRTTRIAKFIHREPDVLKHLSRERLTLTRSQLWLSHLRSNASHRRP